MAIEGIKERIIQAAAAEFLQKGSGGARMQVIADKAGINKALLHYHFQTKQRLYETVLRQQFSKLIDSLFEQLEKETDFDTWLQSLIRKYLREIMTAPGLSRFVLWELNSGAKVLPQLFKKCLADKGHDPSFILTTINKRLQDEGLGNIDPVHFLLNLLALCIYPVIAKPILEQILGSGYFKAGDFIASREEEIFKLLKQGIYRQNEEDK